MIGLFRRRRAAADPALSMDGTNVDARLARTYAEGIAGVRIDAAGDPLITEYDLCSVCSITVARALGAALESVRTGNRLTFHFESTPDEVSDFDGPSCERCGIQPAATCECEEPLEHDWNGAFCSRCGADEASSFASAPCSGFPEESA